jgi:hypothetical protein
MPISKSSRHQKIIGEYGEMLTCNWLSRNGLEVSRVDHTGIDVIAYDPRSKRRLGITVKSRTRSAGSETGSVSLFRNPKERDRAKLAAACEAFECEPWIAIYVETADAADLFLTSLDNFDEKYCTEGSKNEGWGMSKSLRQQYVEDPRVAVVHVDFTVSGGRASVYGG